MLGQPISMLTPNVIGFELIGAMPAGATATDLVLTVTEMLRSRRGGKFVEFFGPGLSRLTLPTAPPSPTWLRSMAPLWASSRWMKRLCASLIGTGRSEELEKMVARYTQAQGFSAATTAPHPSTATCWSWT